MMVQPAEEGGDILVSGAVPGSLGAECAEFTREEGKVLSGWHSGSGATKRMWEEMNHRIYRHDFNRSSACSGAWS